MVIFCLTYYLWGKYWVLILAYFSATLNQAWLIRVDRCNISCSETWVLEEEDEVVGKKQLQGEGTEY